MSYYENRYTGPTSPSVVEMEQRVGEVSPRGSTVKDVANYEEAPPPYYTKPFPNGNRTAGESTTTTGGNTWAPTPTKTPAGADPEDPEADCCDEECQECCGPFLCMILIMGVIGLIIWAIVEASDGGGGGGYRGGGCFPAGTPVLMEDGSYKAIDNIRLGDHLAGGGRVQGTMQFEGEEMFLYDGIAVGGAHTVYDEASGKWAKIAIVGKAAPELGIPDVFYDLITEKHRILIKKPDGDSKSHVLFADYAEIDWSKEIEDYELSVLNSGKGTEISAHGATKASLASATCAKAA